MSALPVCLLPSLAPRVSMRALRAALPRFRRARTGAPSGGASLDASAFELREHTGAGRAATEAFINQCFAERFGSRIEAFMPRLFSVRNAHDEICGAFGLRSATRKLFLEQYLDVPIDCAIAAHTGQAVDRSSIIEVGHFSGAFPGAVRAMIGLLTAHLHHEGYAWVVFTGTTDLRNAFYRLGLSPLDIQAASADRLPADARAAWGSYYEHGPRVLVGNVEEGHRAMLAAAAPTPFAGAGA